MLSFFAEFAELKPPLARCSHAWGASDIKHPGVFLSVAEEFNRQCYWRRRSLFNAAFEA